jgi:glycosyltransferase involved in cell wall biosynthesis
MRRQLERTIGTFDLVHTHLPFVYPTLLAGRAAIRAGKPLFYSQRGVYDPARIRFRGVKKMAYINLVEKRIMKRATTLIALTPQEEDSYRALGVRTSVRIVPNGVHTHQYRTVPQPGSRWAKMSDGIVILFLGRLHPIKGADKLLEAFLAVAADYPDTSLVMAGPDEWDLRSKYEQRVAYAGLSKRVLFPGTVLDEDKKDLRADLFCLPSLAEGFSMAVLEAMASGTAVLLSPRCYFPGVEQRKLGAIANSEPAAIAAALRKLLSDRRELTGMGRRGHNVVASEYSWDAVTDQLLDVYTEGIARHARQKGK